MDSRASQLQAGDEVPTAPTPDASLPLDASLLSIVAHLDGLDLDGLRRQWRTHLGGEPPAHLSRWLLMKVVVYRLQSEAFGDSSMIDPKEALRSGKRIPSALLSTAARPRRERASV